MTSLSLTKRAIQGIQIKWEVLKNSYAFIFFPANFMPSFHRDHVGNYDTRLSLEERNLKLFIWVSTSQSVPREMQKDTVLKLTKKFLPYHHFWKSWSYLWTTDLILWILQLRGQACGAQGWVRMLSNIIVIIILKLTEMFLQGYITRL